MKSLTAIALAVAVTGCADMKKLDDWAMNKALEDRGQVGQLQPEQWAGDIKVPAEANCSFSATYKQIHNCCIMPKYTTSLDVDTGFARVMQEYSFTQWRKPGEGDGYPHYHGQTYQAQPAAFYRLAGEVYPRSDVKLSRGVWMSFMVVKASATTAEVEPVYCEARGRRMQDQLAWHQSVQESIKKALPPISHK